jgi:inosine-uridine nucleoside N-ribohydrolase
MQFASTAKPATAILYDSDFGRNIDSVLALALLHGFAGKLQARVSALTVNYPCLEAAQLCDVIEAFYRKAVTGPAAAYMSAPAIGVPDPHGKPAEAPALVKGTLAKPWQSNVSHWSDTAAPEVLIRNNLAAQNDGNAVLVMTGAATNLSRLLALHDTGPLISAKVKMLVIAGGFEADAAAAKHVLAEWPTPIVFCGSEIGNELLFPGKSIETDFSYAPQHPVVDAYRAYRAMPYDAPSCGLAAMLYAIRPGDGYFTTKKLEKHSSLVLVAAKHDEVIQKFTEMVSAKPVAVRPFRDQPKEPVPKAPLA